MDLPATARESKMNKVISHRSNTAIACVFLLASLASANVLAEMRVLPDDAAKHAGDAGRNAGPAASLQTTSAEEALKRLPYSARASAQSGFTPSARVYLDDYQRIPQQVTRQHPTKPYFLGKKNPSRQGSG
jgi:hypothetical protein